MNFRAPFGLPVVVCLVVWMREEPAARAPGWAGQ